MAGRQSAKQLRRKRLQRERRQRALSNHDINLNTDVRTAAEQGSNLAAPGIFDAGSNKKDALDTLISRLPPSERPQANRDRAVIMSRTGVLGHQEIKPADEGTWKMKGLKTPLRHHQAIAAGWMKHVETTSDNCDGGVLADQMGLGKTVTMLALIVNTLPPTTDEIRATLIVCPANITSQWKAEIAKHCERTGKDNANAEGLAALMFCANDKPGSGIREIEVQSREIAVAGYTDVLASWKTKKANGDYGGGILHNVEWLRVCLDESQAIKNERAATSHACRALHREYGWCLTGTPVMNGLMEFYPIFDFIRHPAGKNRAAFKKIIRDPNTFVHTELNDVMLRRTYGTKLLGSRLVELPSTSHSTITVRPGKLEAGLYRFVRDRFAACANELDASTNKRQTRALVFELIVRLRQLASHPISVQYVLVALLQKDDVNKLLSVIDPHLYTEKNDILLARHLQKVINKSIGPEGKQAKQAAKLKAVKLAAGLRHPHEQKATMPTEQTSCQKCGNTPEYPQITSCRHLYCAVCLEDLSSEWASHGLDGCLCIATGCGALFDNSEPYFPNPEFDDDQNDDFLPGTSHEDLVKAIRKCRLMPDGEVDDWLDEHGKVWDSAKMAEIRKKLRSMLEDETVKVIVYTQWMPIVKLLSCLCKEEGWNSCNYTGQMSPSSKDRAIKDFNAKPKTRVMIASLRAAGVGLNLAVACRVINMDSWWNTALEEQAFSRVYRIGQERETQVYEMVVRGTIEERMTRTKANKDKVIDGVVQKTNTSGLSLSELTAALNDEDC